MLCPCLTIRLPPPEQLGGQQREGGDQQASDDEERARDIAGRRDPGDPRRGDGEHKDGSKRADQQRAEVHAEPEPACLLQAPAGWFAPVIRDETWDPPEVGEDMDGDQREPEQSTHAGLCARRQAIRCSSAGSGSRSSRA